MIEIKDVDVDIILSVPLVVGSWRSSEKYFRPKVVSGGAVS